MAPPPAIPPRPSGYGHEKSALRLTNLQNGETVYTRLIIVEGTLGTNGPTGSLNVRSDSRSGFGEHVWEINQGYFKALVPLPLV